MVRLRAYIAAAISVTLLTACVTLAGGAGATDRLAGEWVDIKKSSLGDTVVWVLTPSGDDDLLRVTSIDGLRSSARRHYGRWMESVDEGTKREEVCFIRRPGRDAASCVLFSIDTVYLDGRLVRRLHLRGYVGEHHTADRELLERRQPPMGTDSARARTPMDASTTAAPPSPEGSAGSFQPHAVQPERPSVATHAGTVAPGFAEWESGVEYDRNDDGTTAGSAPVVLKLGLTKRTQLSLQLPVTRTTEGSAGFGDVTLGVKWRLVEDHPLLQDIALLPQVKLPSGGLRGTGTTDVGLLLINSRTLGPVGLDLNVGFTQRSGDGTRAPRTATMWAIAAGIPVHRTLGWTLECFGSPGTGGPAGASPVVAILTGPTLVARQNLELDLGIIVPVTGQQPRAIYAGLVSNLGALFSRKR